MHNGFGPLEDVVLDCGMKAMEVVMLQRERPRSIRLGIELEADALLSIAGAQAHSIALKRAKEASSAKMARDWSVVAATVARKSGARSSLLDALFG
jgi:hypothetical protein